MVSNGKNTNPLIATMRGFVVYMDVALMPMSSGRFAFRIMFYTGRETDIFFVCVQAGVLSAAISGYDAIWLRPCCFA